VRLHVGNFPPSPAHEPTLDEALDEALDRRNGTFWATWTSCEAR
jgi:hypothetical protein